jgi:predicted RNA-binding Zn ribbon-like protein
VTAADTSLRWTRFAIHLAEVGGGAPLCLSLCNTRHWRNSAAPRETIADYADVVKWAVAKGLYASADGDALVAEAAKHPHVATTELRRTLRLREAMAQVFAAHAGGRTPDTGAMAEIVESFDDAMREVRWRIVGSTLQPVLASHAAGLEVARWQAATSGMGLLGSPTLARVKQCADDRGCGWLFLDTTRNASRQFCFSNECGNRARQVRFRARHQEGEPAAR